jgi:hypothetical protein
MKNVERGYPQDIVLLHIFDNIVEPRNTTQKFCFPSSLEWPADRGKVGNGLIAKMIGLEG